jgi:hypothetical protein
MIDIFFRPKAKTIRHTIRILLYLFLGKALFISMIENVIPWNFIVPFYSKSVLSSVSANSYTPAKDIMGASKRPAFCADLQCFMIL